MLVGGLVKLTRQFARRTLGIGIALVLSCGGLFAQAPPQQAPPAGGVQASGSKYRVLRSVSGSKGSQQAGRYVIEDPRTVFYIPADKQVIVYFEWEGPPGHHRFEGFWKNPDGKVSVISDFEYDSRERRFGGYWSLLLGETMQAGLWMLEAHVDGEVAGTHSFQVVAAAKPTELNAAPARNPLTQAEIYKRASAASVFIEKLNAVGERLSTGSGFFVGENLVATTFGVIDGASALRVILFDGRTISTSQILAWDRRQDWVILQVEAGETPKLLRAPADSWAIGDRCYSLDVPAESNRVILDADIIGKNTFPIAGERINLNFGASHAAAGAPLLNEYGEVIGMMGGALLPGSGSLEGTRFGYSPGALHVAGAYRGALAVPITQVKLNPPHRATLADLAATGVMIPPLVAHRHVMSGTLARSIDRNSGIQRALDERYEFTHKDGQFYAFLGWDPKERIKGMVTLRAFDIDNRLVAESPPKKLELRPGEPIFLDWKFPITSLPPGIYRLDVTLNNEPAWRTFFRIKD
jgi:hypothetical protein